VLEILERLVILELKFLRFPHDLTAGIVSNDIHLLNHIIGHSVNGITYTGLRGRTTGAP
jgi:1-pyrroline-5-carboxylate dehydrogenase